MLKYTALQSSASFPAVVTGGWLAKQTPGRQLDVFVAAAARQTTITRHTLKQLAAMAGLPVHQFREVRRQHGAPIRPKKRRASAALPAPVTASSVDAASTKPAPTILSVPASPASASPAKLPTAQQVADLIAMLRSFGSQNLLNAAIVAEHDEHQAARHLNGGASHAL
jgi:hypothetical protein